MAFNVSVCREWNGISSLLKRAAFESPISAHTDYIPHDLSAAGGSSLPPGVKTERRPAAQIELQQRSLSGISSQNGVSRLVAKR